MAVTAPETKALAARRYIWSLAPVCVALLAAGLAAIDPRRSFTLAEVEWVLQSGRQWRDLVPIWHADASGSVYLALLKGWLHVGSAERVARVPSVVAVALTAALVYALGARLFDRSAGVAAGVLFATIAFTTGLGRNVGPLALAVLAATLATWLFVVATESRGRIAWSAYAVVAAASVYIHASCVLVLVAHAATFVVMRRTGGWRSALPSILVAALAAPAVVQVLASQRHLIDALDQPSLVDVAGALHAASGRNVVLIVLAAAGIAGLALWPGTKVDAWKVVLLTSWALIPLVGVLVLSIARPSLDPRYVAVSAPALSLSAGVALTRLLRPKVAAVAAIGVLALVGVRLTQLERSTPENWRAATAYALSAKEAQDRIVVAPARAISAFAFYAGRDRGSLTPGGPVSLVIVRARSDDDALEISRRAARAPTYALRGERRFGSSLRVQQWERTGLPAS